MGIFLYGLLQGLKAGEPSFPVKPRASGGTVRADPDGGGSMASVRKISSAVVPVHQSSLSLLKAPPMTVLFPKAAGFGLSGPRLAMDALQDEREAVADNSGEGSSAGAPHLPASYGMIFNVMDYFDRQGHLQVTNKDLAEIAKMSSATSDHRHALPVIAVTLQALASHVDLVVSLRRLAKKEKLFCPPLVYTDAAELITLQPWDDGSSSKCRPLRH